MAKQNRMLSEYANEGCRIPLIYTCRFKLIPLLEGLKTGKIVTELVEKQEFSITSPKAYQEAIR